MMHGQKNIKLTSRVLWDCTHAVKVNCILLSKNLYFNFQTTTPTLRMFSKSSATVIIEL